MCTVCTSISLLSSLSFSFASLGFPPPPPSVLTELALRPGAGEASLCSVTESVRGDCGKEREGGREVSEGGEGGREGGE